MDDAVQDYLAGFDGDVRNRLDTLRALVAATVPDAVESISYGLIGWKLDGRPLVYVGGFTHHVGLYATPNGHAAFAAEFAPYKQGKGSVQFPHERPLPVELVERVVRHRVDQLRP